MLRTTAYGNITHFISRRFLADQPPKKFKNFSEMSQAYTQPLTRQMVSKPPSEPAKPQEKPAPKAAAPAPAPASPKAPTPPPKVEVQSPKKAPTPAANKAAGEEYLVPEYFQHNEYSFYDLNADMLKGRIPQPKSERRM